MQRLVYGLGRLRRSTEHRCFPIPSTNPSSRSWLWTQEGQSNLQVLSARNVLHSTTLPRDDDNDDDRDDDLLIRGRHYGITSRRELDRESNFDLKPDEGNLLVDQPPYRHDLKLWNILTDYRVRRYGSKGATMIWRGLKYRGPRVSLDSEDVLTTDIWQKLLQCAAKHDDLGLTKRLCERNGLAWNRPKLFAETISALLRSERDFQIVIMCDRLKEKHQNGVADVLDLYNTFQPQDHNDLRAFCAVYERVRPGKMYGKSIAHLFRESRPEDAFVLHKFLVSRGDFPSSFNEIEPFMRYLAKKGEDPGPFLRTLAASGIVFSAQGRLVHEHERREIALHSYGSTLTSGKSHYASYSNKVSDAFAAKAFATKALSFEFILNALRAFGLTEIGPQSIREIGLAASSLDRLSIYLAKLDEVGIDTGGSAYSRFVRKLSLTGNATLLHQVLRTDMHHDVFEDTHLQQRLLVEAFNKCAWAQVNLLLAMLNQGQASELNRFIRSALLYPVVNDDSKTRSFLTMISSMKENTIRLPQILIHDLTDYLNSRLPGMRRQRAFLPNEYRRRARFTAGILQDCLAHGQRVTEPQWRFLIAQLGRSGALQEVQQLTIWLAIWYSEQVGQTTRQGQYTTMYLNTLKWIFDHRFQGALIQWALREQFYGKPNRVRHPWQTTLSLLLYLEERCGIKIHLITIREAVVSFVQGLHRRSASGLRARRADIRKADSKRLCLRLLKTVDKNWSRKPLLIRPEKKFAVD